MDAVRATSDLHLSQRTADWVFAALENLRKDAAKRGGHTVLCGDIWDQPKMIHMPTWNRLLDMLQSFDGNVWVIAGNHDQYSGTRNALEGLESPGIRVISEATMTPIGLMVPYYPPSQFWGEVNRTDHPVAIKRGPGDIWWTHQGWKGSYLNNMVRDRDGLSPKDCPAKLVITGHYHMPQNLGPIIYCGSPYETSFAEEGQQKGWLKWSGDLLPERIPFEGVTAPRHHTVYWTPGSGEPIAPEGFTEGDKVRIITEASRDEVKAAASQLKRAGLSGAAIVAQPKSAPESFLSDPSAKPVSAARSFIDGVHGPEVSKMNPEKLHDWAKEAGLWD